VIYIRKAIYGIIEVVFSIFIRVKYEVVMGGEK